MTLKSGVGKVFENTNNLRLGAQHLETSIKKDKEDMTNAMMDLHTRVTLLEGRMAEVSETVRHKRGNGPRSIMESKIMQNTKPLSGD